jgi:outer membrane protein assembly factor BamA
MYRPLVVSLVAFVLVSVSRFLSAQASCDKPFVVLGVSLPKTTQLSASEQAAIRARLIGRCFDDQQFGELASGVRDVLQSIGYLRAAVTVMGWDSDASDTSRYPRPVSLNVEVKEGARYKVREIQLHGYKTVSADQIYALLQIQVEDFFDSNKMRETAEALRKLYAARGYLNASIVPRFDFLGGPEVCVHFYIVEGPQLP